MSSQRLAKAKTDPVRYAVVGLGHIAQVAVLPAFAHADNSVIAALVSDDDEKLARLGRKYRVDGLYSYSEFGRLLRSGDIDAVYITLPNHLHRRFAVRAAEAGIHVLCEKPLAVTSADCRTMIRAAERGGVRLMTAYRLHFDPANLSVVELARSRRLGDLKLFNSTFTMQVKPGNIRLGPRRKGGGVLYDIGIYCINAARTLFRAEPEVVFASEVRSGERRFKDVEESVAAVLRFPGGRMATFTASFGAADVASFHLVGTRGEVHLDPAYAYAQGIERTIAIDGKKQVKKFPRSDQFAPELVSFSRCVLDRRSPEPSGREGLADVRIIEALYRSASTRRPVKLPPFEKRTRATAAQAMRRPPVAKPKLVKVSAPDR